jgi:amino acid transporter
MAILKSISEMTPALITNLGARIFFMLLTVSIACLALTILRKQDEVDQKRIRRLKNLTLVSETLNHIPQTSGKYR